jgi:hypothetical protein
MVPSGQRVWCINFDKYDPFNFFKLIFLSTALFLFLRILKLELPSMITLVNITNYKLEPH